MSVNKNKSKVFASHMKHGLKKSTELIARCSYLVKGILYCGVAVFILRMAIGLSRQKPNRQEVLESLFLQPFGQVTLILITLALTAHTIWRLVETINDPYQKGKSAAGLLHRFTYLLSGLSYGSLAITAFKLLSGNGKGSGNSRRIWVAGLLHWEGGEWLVVLAGGIIVSWATLQLKKAVTPGLYRSLQTDHLAPLWLLMIRIAGGIGFMTQSAILAAIGFYMIRAAWTRNPRQVKNVDDLFELIGRLPEGINWLSLIAGGLFLFGLFMFVMARYFPLKLDKS